MKSLILRFLLLLPFLGILSCNNASLETPTNSGSVQIAARIFLASGESIPTADTVRFLVEIGSRKIDTAVAWSLRGIDFGAVEPGARIRWQATAYSWNAARTVRTVVWASQTRDTVAQADNNTTTFTLQTPVVANLRPSPVPSPSGFLPDTAGKVALPSSAVDTFRFAITAPAGTARVWIDDTLVQPSAGSEYFKILRVPAGATISVKVFLQDSLGGASVTSYGVTRAKTIDPVDTSVVVSFLSPTSDTSVSSGTTSVAVKLKVQSRIAVDSVKIGSVQLRKGADTTVWTGDVPVPTEGTNSLVAEAFVGKNVARATRNVVRASAGGVTVSIVRPAADGNFPVGTFPVHVTTASSTPVDSVMVEIWTAGRRISRSKAVGGPTNWMDTLVLQQGVDTLVAIAYVAGQPTSSLARLVRVVEPVVLAFSPSARSFVDTLNVTVSAPGADSILVSTDSVVWTRYIKALTLRKTSTLRARAYQLGAVSATGSATFTAMVAGSHDTTLKALSIGSIGFTSTFAPNKQTYTTLALPNNVLSVTLNATPTDSSAKVTFNDSTSGVIALTGTMTPVSVKVTNGGSTLTYTVKILRAPAAPTFTPAGGSFTTSQSVTVSAPQADSILVSADSLVWTLYTGTQVLTKTTTLWARAYQLGVGSATSSATFTATAAVAHDTTLKALSIGGIGFTSAFAPNKQTYTTLTLPSNTASVTINATPTDPSAAVTFNGSISGGIALMRAVTPVVVKVTNGGSTLTYTVNILRAPVAPTFTPAGGSFTTSQSVTVSAPEADSILVSTDSLVWTLYTGAKVLTKTTTLHARAYQLGVGSATSSATFTAAAVAHDTTLKALSIGGVSFTSAFAPGTLSYTTLTLPSNYASVTLTATPTDPSAAVTFNGNIFGVIGLTTAVTPVVVKVTNGSSTLTYTVNIIRAPAAPTFSPVGGSFTTNQSVTISAPEADSIQVSADSLVWTLYTGAQVLTKTTTLHARAYQSGVVSATSSATYTKAADATLAWLGFTGLTPAFSPNTTSYAVSMTPGSGGQCYPTDPAATVTMTNGTYSLNGGKGYCSPALGAVGTVTDVKITVTNGASQTTYTVAVTRL